MQKYDCHRLFKKAKCSESACGCFNSYIPLLNYNPKFFKDFGKKKSLFLTAVWWKFIFIFYYAVFQVNHLFFGVCELVPRLRVLADQTMMLIIRKLFRVTFFWKSWSIEKPSFDKRWFSWPLSIIFQSKICLFF